MTSKRQKKASTEEFVKATYTEQTQELPLSVEVSLEGMVEELEELDTSADDGSATEEKVITYPATRWKFHVVGEPESPVTTLEAGSTASALFIRPVWPEIYNLVLQYLQLDLGDGGKKPAVTAAPEVTDPANLFQTDVVKHLLPVTSCMVTGTPGIGKSAFLSYVIARLVTTKRRFSMVIDARDGQLTLVRPDEEKKPVTGTPEQFAEVLDDPSTLYLWDMRPNSAPLPVSCHRLLISSPNYELQKYARKEGVILYFMPLWTAAELDLCRQACFPHITAKEMYEAVCKHGPTPRAALSDLAFPIEFRRQNERTIRDAVTALDLDRVRKFVETTVAVDKGGQISHRIFHLAVPETGDDAFTLARVRFASRYISDLFAEACIRKEKDNCIAWLSKSPSSFEAAVYGQLFESFVHRLLSESGGSFPARNLTTNEQLKISVPPSSTISFSTISDIDTVPPLKYAVPTISNFPVIDSLMKDKTTLLFSITVSASHGALASQLDQILHRNEVVNPLLVFVVPPHLLKSFVRQKYLVKKGTVARRLPASVNALQQVALGVDVSQVDAPADTTKVVVERTG